jgi:hypothetical protein
MAQTTGIAASTHAGGRERCAGHRTKLARKLLFRPCNPRYSQEVCVTSNVSRGGLHFVTSSKHYQVGMRVDVISGYVPNDPCNFISLGEIVRVDKLEDPS